MQWNIFGFQLDKHALVSMSVFHSVMYYEGDYGDIPRYDDGGGMAIITFIESFR
jgi:hypothetical protein